jgi:hypothetical protein
MKMRGVGDNHDERRQEEEMLMTMVAVAMTKGGGCDAEREDAATLKESRQQH